MITDELRAKYVFGQLTLKDAFDLATQEILAEADLAVIEVTQDDITWNYCYWCLTKKNLVTYDGDENCDNENPAHSFPLKQNVVIKGNVVYLKDKDGHEAEIKFLKTSPVEFDFK